MFRRAAPEPLLSVIVPVYNVEEYLAECLESLLFTPLNQEIILVDDGSTDRSAKIARRFARHHREVGVVTRPNGGLSAARMTGLEHASAPYVTFVDSDDVMSPTAIWAAMWSLEETGSDYALMPYQQFRDIEDPSPVPPWIAEIYGDEVRTVVAHEHPETLAQATAWSKIYRRSFWDRAGLAFREGVLYEDQEVTARAFAAADRIDLVPDLAYLWRVRPGSITREATERSIGAFFDAIALSLDALDGVSGARAARASQVLSNDVPRYLRTLAKVADEGYRERLFRGALDLLGESGLDLSQAPAEARVVYALLQAGRAADVQVFVERGGFDLPSLRSDDVDGRPALAFPFTGDPDVPAEARVLSERQTPLDATVLRARLDESGLRLTIAAWLRHVDAVPTCRAWLRDITGWEREFAVTPSDEFIGHRVRTTRRSNEDSVWNLELALPDLDDVDSSELVVELTHHGRTRREVVTRIDPLGSAAIREEAAGLTLTGEEPWALDRDDVVLWKGDLADPADVEIPTEIGEHEVPGRLVDQALALQLPWDFELEDRQGYLALAGPRRLKVVVQPKVPREQLTFWWQRDHAGEEEPPN
nr:glycosyltransferase [Aeromicrobium phoceense]